MNVIAIQSVSIRQAMIQDLPEIIGCGLQFWKEMPWRIIRPNPDPVYIAEWLMKLDHRSTMFLAEEEKRIIGLCGGTIVDFPMVADLPYLWEWVLWVEPSQRGTKTSTRLWDAMTAWAKERGAKGCVRGKPEMITETMIRETLLWRWW